MASRCERTAAVKASHRISKRRVSSLGWDGYLAALRDGFRFGHAVAE
jgi:hypothetical protein